MNGKRGGSLGQRVKSKCDTAETKFWPIPWDVLDHPWPIRNARLGQNVFRPLSLSITGCGLLQWQGV